MSSSQASKSSSISATDIILSCTICQETLSSIYAEGDQKRGLRKDAQNPHNDRITKFWLTECAHLTCGKHLEGGGVPFHPNQQYPRAPCPFCIVEKNDRSFKALFFINGTSKGEYDSNIPDAYFQTPPVQLGGGDTGFEALRFHYLALVRFGIKTHEKAIRLRNALEQWENKKAEIVRSLSNIPPLRDELLSAGRKLMAFGQDVSSIKAALGLVGASQLLHHQQHADTHSQQPSTNAGIIQGNITPSDAILDAGSRLALGSAEDLDNLSKAGMFTIYGSSLETNPILQDGSSVKRKRVDSRHDIGSGLECVPRGRQCEKGQSRDQMPPPPIPLPQPFVYMARTPSPEACGPNPQSDPSHPLQFRRAPVTPRPQPFQSGLSSLRKTPGDVAQQTSGVSNAFHLHGIQHGPSQAATIPHRRFVTPGPAAANIFANGWQLSPRSPNSEPLLRCTSSLSSLPSTGQPPVRRNPYYHPGSMMFSMELGNRIVDPRTRSYQSYSSDGSEVFYRRQAALAATAQVQSPSRPSNVSPHWQGRITLPRTPSFVDRRSSNHGIGLSGHARSSTLQTNQPSANSSSHRQRLGPLPLIEQVPALSPHFSLHQGACSTSMPVKSSQYAATLCHRKSLDTGPTSVNGEMRPNSNNVGIGNNVSSARHLQSSHNCSREPPGDPQSSGYRRLANR